MCFSLGLHLLNFITYLISEWGLGFTGISVANTRDILSRILYITYYLNFMYERRWSEFNPLSKLLKLDTQTVFWH